MESILNKLPSATKLIRDEIPGVGIVEFKSLPEQDRFELASAIARSKGMTQEQVGFELVVY